MEEQKFKLRVTRADLRKLGDGETKSFEMTSARACDTGKVVAYQYQNQLGCKFRVRTDYATNTLTITRYDNN